MGCCSSKNVDSKASRVARWRSTGIVALRDSKLKTFPDEVLDLERSVRTLDLTHNKLVDIPMEISKLINLQRLHQEKNFKGLRYVTRVDSPGSNTSTRVGLIDCVRDLLDRKERRRVHDSVQELVGKLIDKLPLHKILADNVIERLPMNLGKLQSLKVMTLDGNRVTTLPDELGQLVKLERLSICGNLLLNLPETIGSLRNLVLLNVSNNKIKFLPESIGSCFSLEEIQANENSIEELPSSVCNLVHLKSLCLNNNNVKQIPPNLLKDCKSLQNISLHGNPISMDYFQQMEGFEDFEGRRKRKFDKQIDSNVMINSKGLDEGVDL